MHQRLRARCHVAPILYLVYNDYIDYIYGNTIPNTCHPSGFWILSKKKGVGGGANAKNAFYMIVQNAQQIPRVEVHMQLGWRTISNLV